MTDPEMEPKKILVLSIAVDGFWADDLDESAAMIAEPDPPDADHRLDVVTEWWVRDQVGLFLVGIPGEKCMNDDFVARSYDGRLVGAHTVDRAAVKTRWARAREYAPPECTPAATSPDKETDRE